MISHPKVATRHPKENTPAWVKITRHLNSIGPARSMKAWRQTWKDLKNRVCSRAYSKGSSSSLQGRKERQLRKLLGMTSHRDPPETDRPPSETDGETVEEYITRPESEVAVAPRAPSPRTVLYNLAEILARNNPMNENNMETNNKKSTPETSVSNETNDILRELVLELKRSNELKVEQNCHLKDILHHLKPPTCAHASQNSDIPTPIDVNQTDTIDVLDVQKQEEDTLDHVTEDQCNEVANDEVPAERAPVIRPVAISSLTSIDTPGQFKRVQVQSIVNAEPKTMARRIIRLKDGSVLLMPSNMKTQAKPNQDKNGDQLYVVCARKRR
ncbi:uncharacterized protein LOC134750537 [Cydia strobilella]|uniref:uncharacterized protein LOC134750537 n=1 Tax=Cydia strobilella TaxID=1100964 RepID=UPI003004900C